MTTRIVQLHESGKVSTYTGWGPLATAVGLKKKSLCDMYNTKRKTQSEAERELPVVISGLNIVKTVDNKEVE